MLQDVVRWQAPLVLENWTPETLDNKGMKPLLQGGLDFGPLTRLYEIQLL